MTLEHLFRNLCLTAAAGLAGAVFAAPAFDEYGDPLQGTDRAVKARAADALAARVLNTTTFGQTPALVVKVRDMGAAAWVDEQLALPVTPLPEYPYYPALRPATCTFTTSASTPESLCARDNYTLYQVQNAFFLNALQAPDQLRQRVAFALSQIFVVSGTEVSMAYAMRNYQQKLVDGAFGNFYDLLYNVTRDPAMGRYLDMVNNAKPNATGTVQPNENYARELLQLFTVGVWKLNPDGSLVIDASGNAVPTYDQEEVEAFAHVFTGWTYPPRPGATSRWTNPPSYHAPMVPIESQHDTGAKTLLGGEVLPAGQRADANLRAALSNIFRHPNVGPFISRQLIQHLVTSNPSAAFVRRVVSVFDDNGRGIRGDLRAVVRAIVLDPEALETHGADYGKLKEPVLYTASLVRAMGGTSDGLYLRQQASGMGQNVFNSPSVFNFYPAEYIIPATDLDGPSFGLYNATTVFARANFAYQMTYGGGANPDPLLAGAIGTHLDLAPWQPLAGDPIALVESLAERLLPGQWTAALRDSVVPAVAAISATNSLNRVRAAAYLIAISPKFQVER